MEQELEADTASIFPDLLAAAQDPARQWGPLREGVEVSWLYQVEGGLSSAFLRFAPGARLPRHRHTGHEHIFILHGSQRDENGLHRPGAMLLHPPETRHTVSSETGCLVLAIWERPVVFDEE
jgi:anti-sigma factor ChrR (cupin superfamily)